MPTRRNRANAKRKAKGDIGLLSSVQAGADPFIGKDAWNAQQEERRRLENLALQGELARRADEQKQSERRTSRVTLASTVVALAAALGAVWGGYEAHEARVQDERPYIRAEFGGVAKEIIDHSEGAEPTFEPHLKTSAFGRSPAKDIEVNLACSSLPPSETSFVFKSEITFGRALTQPVDLIQQMFPSEFHVEHCYEDSPLREDAGEATGSVYVYGRISYRDMGGRKYQTPFCFQWTKIRTGMPESLMPCFAPEDLT